MSDESQTDRTEEATPFRMRKARERGQVARGMDLGFVASLLAVTIVALAGAQGYVAQVAEVMRHMLGGGVAGAAKHELAGGMGELGSLYWFVLQPLVLLGLVIALIVVGLEIVQLRGFFFTTHPLKPDFQRLNPAKGLKRIFSFRMIKETMKNVLKMGVYAAAAWFVVSGAIERLAPATRDARNLATGIESSLVRLLFTFIALAFGFMVVDQLLVRREHRKQLRMSRRDVVRETKDHEGEPRLKQRRRELHAQMREQTDGMGKVAGSDFLLVNPSHVAVALRYDATTMAAPQVRAKGRDHLAQLLKRKARQVGVPTMPRPALARALFEACEAGEEIPPAHYREVAAVYRRWAQARDVAEPATGNAP